MESAAQPAPNSGVKAARSRYFGLDRVTPIDILVLCELLLGVGLLPFFVSADGEPYVQFWMAYFLATPHRCVADIGRGRDRPRSPLRQDMAVRRRRRRLAAAPIRAMLWPPVNFGVVSLTVLLGWHFAF